MGNFLNGAKFGDKFLTSNGMCALYLKKTVKHHLYVQNSGIIEVNDDGMYYGLFKPMACFDIVARWGQVDNNKELTDEEIDKVAQQEADVYGMCFADSSNNCKINRYEGFYDGFMAGYKTKNPSETNKPIHWKPITEIPTEHSKNNDAISPHYIVLCDGKCGKGGNLPIVGMSYYNFLTKEWPFCWNHIGEPNSALKVIAWMDGDIIKDFEKKIKQINS